MDRAELKEIRLSDSLVADHRAASVQAALTALPAFPAQPRP